MSDELKPCAHCGGVGEKERWSHVDWDEWRIICGRCGTSSDWYTSLAVAMDAWNTRVDSENREPSLKESTDDTQVLSDSRERLEAATWSECFDPETRTYTLPGDLLVPNSNQLEPDSREKLEADVYQAAEEMEEFTHGEKFINTNKILRWLDRQAAITEREAFMRGRASLDDEFAELTAERDELQEQHGRQVKTIERLTAERELYRDNMLFQAGRVADVTAERGELKEEIAKYEHDCGLLFDEKHKLTAERDELRKRCDALQADVRFKESQLDANRFAFETVRGEYEKLEAERDRLQKVVLVQAESFKGMERELKEANDTCNTLRASVAGLKGTVERYKARDGA